MLRDAHKGLFGVILIHKYDRVARALSEHVNLEGRLRADNVELIAVAQDFGNTAEAKIMRSLMWSMSEYYLDNLSAEVQKGHRETALEATEPPEDYTVDTIRQWLNALKNSPDEKAVRLLIERIDFSGDKKNNLFNIQSTLNRLLEKMVAGEGNVDYQQYFPKILFRFVFG